MQRTQKLTEIKIKEFQIDYSNFFSKKNYFRRIPWALLKKAYLLARAFVFYIAIASLLAPNLAQGVASFESFVDSNLKSQYANLQQDFAWGVLAMNTDKGVYQVGETAYFEFGVLDEKGEMVCDAELELTIYNKDAKSTIIYSTQARDIKVNPDCQIKAKTLKPDYEAKFFIKQAGTYYLKLTAKTKNGSHTITDGFYVSPKAPSIEIKRSSHTRLYPKVAYEMNIELLAHEDYEGKVRERLPEDFEILGQPTNSIIKVYQDMRELLGIAFKPEAQARIFKEDNQLYIEYNIKLAAGETTILSYTFDAPDVSPEYYTLGPLIFTSPDLRHLAFKEARAWQIANDESLTRSAGTITGVDDAGTGCTNAGGNWVSPANAGASDTNYATFGGNWNDQNEYSDELQFSNFSFAIPDGSTIDGITVEAERFADQAGAYDYNVSLTKTAGVQIGSNYASQGGTWDIADPGGVYVPYGTGTTDLWGQSSWAEAEVENSGFGVVFCMLTPAGKNNVDYYVDHVKITVYYSSPPTFSGTVYDDEATPSALSGKTIKLYKNGSTLLGSTTTEASGYYWIQSASAVEAGSVLTAYIDGDGTYKANTVSIATGTSQTNLNLYGGVLLAIGGTNTASSVTNSILSTGYVSGDTTDMVYSVSGSDLTVNSNVELHIAASDATTDYDPGGTITTQGTGDLHIDDNAAANITTGTSVIARNIVVDSGASLNINGSTNVNGGSITTTNAGSVNYSSGSPTVTISGTGSIGGGTGTVRFYALTTSGSGTTTIASSSTIESNLTVGTGTALIGSATTTVRGGSVTNGGIIAHTGTFRIEGTGNFGGNSNWSFKDLQFGNGSVATSTAIGSGSVTVSGILTITADSSLNAGAKQWNLTASGTPLQVNSGGMFIASSSTVSYSSSENTTMAAVNYYNLNVNPSSGAPTYVFRSDSGSLPPSATGETYNQWDTPANAYSSDDTWASTSAAANKQDYYNFNFIIPAAQTIAGIEVIAEVSLNGVNDTVMLAAELSWDGGSSYTTSGFQVGSLSAATDTLYSLGGSKSTWGRAWSSSEFSNANFRLRLEKITNPQIMSLDQVLVRVYFDTNINVANDFTTTGAGSAILDLDSNDPALTVGGNLSIGSGHTFSASAVSTTTISGNLAINGTFTHNSGTLVFTPTATSTITSSATTTFNNLYTASAGKALAFGQYTGANLFNIAGTLTVSGSPGSLISIVSDSSGNPWRVKFTNPQSTVTYAYIKDSGCDGASAEVALDATSVNGGSNGSCWVFPTLINVSGTVYDTDESSPLLSALAIKMALGAATSYSTTTLASNGTFGFSSVTKPSSGNILTLWLNTDAGTDKGSLVFKYGASCNGGTGSDCTNLTLIKNRVIIDSKNAASLANTDLAACDNDSGTECGSTPDTDIGFTSEGGVLALTGWPINELKITSGVTFAPNGAVSAQKLDVAGIYTGGSETLTLSGTGTNASCANAAQYPLCIGGTFTPNSNTVKYSTTTNSTILSTTYNNLQFQPSAGGSPIYTLSSDTLTVNGTLTVGDGVNAVTLTAATNNTALDIAGSVTINTSGTLIAPASNSFLVGTSWTNNGAFTHSDGTVTFDATTGSKTLAGTLNGSSGFYNLIFNGVGGGWSNSSALLVNNDLTVATGTLSGSSDITVNGGDVTGGGTISLSGGTFTLDGNGSFGGSNNWTFSSLTFGNGSGVSTSTASGSGSIAITGVLTIASQQVLDAGVKTWTLSGNNTPFAISGNLTASTSTFSFTSTSNATITPATYYHLNLQPSGSSPTYTLNSGALTVNGNLVFGDGSNALTVSALSFNPSLTLKGNWTLNNLATFTAGTSTTTLSSASTQTITDNNGTKQDLGIIKISSPTTTAVTNLKVTALTVDTAKVFSMGSNTLTLTGNGLPLIVNGTLDDTSGTVEFVSSATSGTTIPARTYNNLIVNKASNNFTVTDGSLITTGNLTITAGTLDLNTSDPTVTITGNLVINGTASASNSSNLKVRGDFTNNGIFTHNDGTFIIDPTNISTISGSTTFYNFTGMVSDSAANRYVKFQKQTAGSPVFTFVNNFVFGGSSGKPLYLQSDTLGTQWLAHFNIEQNNVTYAYITDSGCDNGCANVNMGDTVSSGGNNAWCWLIINQGGGVFLAPEGGGGTQQTGGDESSGEEIIGGGGTQQTGGDEGSGGGVIP